MLQPDERIIRITTSLRELELLERLVEFGSDELRTRQSLRKLTSISLKDLQNIKRFIERLKTK